ncbi:MAG: DUF1759 domain-containing protein, partial [Candidatus Omnitrophica bacterium]|nr:DUF1759 domain-containing protein [Candidatus Omnitrophota bacterium]
MGYTEKQYELAISKLDKRYGGERRLIQSNMDKLKNLPEVTLDDVTTIENFADKLTDIVAQLIDRGRQAELHPNSVLYLTVLQLIPERLTMNYLEKERETDDLEVFSEWLNGYVTRRLEIAQFHPSEKSQETTKEDEPSKNKSQKNTASKNGVTSKKKPTGMSLTYAVTTNTAEEGSKKSGFSCPLCGEAHHVVKCKNWTDLNTNQRWETAKSKGLCYRCLCEGHLGSSCKNDRKCGIDGCTKLHHRHLHRREKDEKAKTAPTTTSASGMFGVSQDGTVQPRRVALRIIPILLSDKDGNKHQVNAFLDDGSDASYIRREIAIGFKLPITENVLSLNTLSETNKELPSGLVAIEIGNLDGTLSRKLGVRILDRLCNNLRITDWQHQKKKWSHLSEIDFPKLLGQKTVDILIGSDHPELTTSLEERSGRVGEPIARLTPLGWTCVGVIDEDVSVYNSTSSASFHGSIYHTTSDRQMDEHLRSLWNMDVVTQNDQPKLSPEEDKALEKAAASRILHGARYEIGVTWYDDVPVLPDNYYEAERRLLSLEKSLKRKPALSDRVCEGMQQNIDKDYLGFVTDDRTEIPPGWY